MPRRSYKKPTITKDPIYGSFEITKLINYIMKDGKKTVAERLVYSACKQLEEKNLDPVVVLSKAIENVAPSHEVKPKRVGGASYLVPTETRPSRKIFLAFNWIINSAGGLSNKEYHTFDKKLATQLLQAYEGEGAAVEKKRQVEKLAEQNKAFAHFRW